MKQAESGSCRQWARWLAVLIALATVSLGTRAQEALALASGVHVFIGGTGEPSPANRGRVGNIGLVVGDTGAVLINAGASYRHGRALLAAAERIGGKPVVLVVITQPVQEFVMGAAAFADRGIPVLAHRASAELIAARCENCLHNLRQVLGADEMAGSRVQPPDRLIEASASIEAGGRRLELIHPGWGSSPGDLVVRDLQSGVVFAGALVSVGRVPELRDADPAGWRTALANLQALARVQGERIVPGYGPPVAADALDAVRDYITDTEDRVRSLFDAGTPLSAIVRAAHLPRYAGWAMYQPVHGRNVQQRYLALERATLAQ
jgi:glyoxylase-like metal-dependent hydrolase (beta-lactamase superfamily II)